MHDRDFSIIETETAKGFKDPKGSGVVAMGKNLLTAEEIQDLLSWAPAQVNEPEKRSERSPNGSVDNAALAGEVEGREAEEGFGRSRKRKEADPEVKKVDFFRDVLNALGEAIITTDRNGRILFQNAVAKALLDQSLGKNWKKPFEIAVCLLDRTGREQVESPVQRCLAEGCLIPLAPNTILRRPDGSTIAIEGSVSPILHPKGLMEGVVVNFHIARSVAKTPAAPGTRPVQGEPATRTSGFGT